MEGRGGHRLSILLLFRAKKGPPNKRTIWFFVDGRARLRDSKSKRTRWARLFVVSSSIAFSLPEYRERIFRYFFSSALFDQLIISLIHQRTPGEDGRDDDDVNDDGLSTTRVTPESGREEERFLVLSSSSSSFFFFSFESRARFPQHL